MGRECIVLVVVFPFFEIISSGQSFFNDIYFNLWVFTLSINHLLVKDGSLKHYFILIEFMLFGFKRNNISRLL
jgi:hypothetical protein